MAEIDIQRNLEKFLSAYFEIRHEVWDIMATSRIDIMLVHKSDTEKKYPIGIEVKIDEKKRGASLAKWIKQSSRYSGVSWRGYGKALIVTYPQISELYLKEGELMNKHVSNDEATQGHNVATFLSMFGIGELQKYRNWDNTQLCRIVYKGQRIWDMKDDVLRINNYKNLVK